MITAMMASASVHDTCVSQPGARLQSIRKIEIPAHTKAKPAMARRTSL